MTAFDNIGVGIDLGTTNSVIAVYKDGEVNVMVDDQGKTLTPSVVSFNEDGSLVGHAAVKQKIHNPYNTIYEVKRLIGRKFNEPEVQEDIQRWPFKVVDKDGEPRLQVKVLDEVRDKRPEQICAAILIRLRHMACDFLDLPSFTQLPVVITVPVYFNDSQREATLQACDIAGLDVSKIINECSAAAIAYVMKEQSVSKERVLVFDMGGGTTDVALLKMAQNHEITTLASKGNNHLGGMNIDKEIIDQCLELLYEGHQIRLNDNHVAMGRLAAAAERAKCTLSSAPLARIYITDIVNKIPFGYEITKKTFERLCKPILQKGTVLLTNCLTDAQITNDQVDKIILAGGSTRIPYLKTLIEETLPGIPIHSSIHQDEAVAYGAAVQAAKDKGILKKQLNLSEVIPWSLGVAIVDDTVSKIIMKNSKIPVKETKVYETTTDNQKTMSLPIYEGEKQMKDENKHLGSMTLSNIKIAAKGVTKVDLTYEVDKHGILQATAVEKGVPDNKISVKIERYRAHLSQNEIQNLRESTQNENIQSNLKKLNIELETLNIKVQKSETLNPVPKLGFKNIVSEFNDLVQEEKDVNENRYNIILSELRGNIAALSINAEVKFDGTVVCDLE